MDRAEEVRGPNGAGHDGGPAAVEGAAPEGLSQAPYLDEEQARRRGLAEASKFLGRFSQLKAADLRGPVERWRRAASPISSQWFAAEAAVAAAMLATGRHVEQEMLLDQLVSVLRQRGWMRETWPLEASGMSEASVQYTATLALLALLLRDRLTAREFTLLYGPYAPDVPLEELGRE